MHGSHDDDWLKGTPARTVTQALANPNSTCYYVSRSGAPKVGLLMALHLTTAHSYRLPSKLLANRFRPSVELSTLYIGELSSAFSTLLLLFAL